MYFNGKLFIYSNLFFNKIYIKFILRWNLKKYFNELSNVELYEILKARAEIFIVQQKCIYQDLDDFDYNSLHIFY